MRPYVGQPIPRREDERLITGRGRYTDDLAPPNACWAVVLRSPHPHALIGSIRVGAAKACTGVLAVLTHADYRADGLQPIPHYANPADAIDPQVPAFPPKSDLFVFENPQPVLAADKVRYVGEAVAVVVAETLAQARDASEKIEVGYESLPPVVSVEQALASDAPQVWAGAPGNVALDARFGNLPETERAFTQAALVVDRDFPNQRIVNCQMEPRASVSAYDEATETYTLTSGSQGVVRQRAALSIALAIPIEKVRVISPDVGGGFGPRTSLYPESVLVAWAARRLGRPVRWVSDRSEAFLSDFQGRDIATRLAAAFDRRGRFLAVRANIDGNLGAHPTSFAPLHNCYRLLGTVYNVPVGYAAVRGVLTNSTPTSPYRGAGRPEATFAIERLLDIAATELQIDPAEIRRRNLVPKRALPYRNLMGLTYDSGDFRGNMETALLRADWKGFSQRRRASRKRGKLRGIGVANYVEAPVGAVRERADISVSADGEIKITTGTQSTGQGHETVFSQVAADRLGVTLDAIKIVGGDTDIVRTGGGTHSARSMRLVGTLLCEACDKLIANGTLLAAQVLGRPEDEVRFADGLFTSAGTNRSLSLQDLSAQSGTLSASAEIARRIPVHPTGCAVCELEVDPETGLIDLQRYTSVDDVGRPINPLIVDGQVHGGIVQGIGQALVEGLAADAGGQVVTGSFMDYGLPRADRVPSFDVELTEDPTSGNPLGIKGGGEGGITPAPAAVINALVHALQDYGVEHIDMPATPERVWAAIHAGQNRR
jgi:aerobic carbon-monoxide dehydrogenase large subunit